MTTRAEEIAADGPYYHYQSATGLCWLVRSGTLGDVYEYQTELAAINAAEALNAAYKQGQQDRWIPVRERLPLESVKVMVTDEHGTVELAILRKRRDCTVWADSAEDGYSWWTMEAWTYWTPLPPNPEQR